MLNPETPDDRKILGQKRDNKASVKNIESIAMDVQIPDKI
jgi:hypothetical protein